MKLRRETIYNLSPHERKLYINHIVHFMNLIEQKLDMKQLKKLFNCIYVPKVDIEFTMGDVDNFNKYIQNKDSNLVNALLEKKYSVEYKTLMDMIHLKNDNLLQLIVDNVQQKYENTELKRYEFFNQLSYYEKIAITVNRFDYHIQKDDLDKWVDKGIKNEYRFNIEELHSFVKESDFGSKDDFVRILHNMAQDICVLDMMNNKSSDLSSDTKTEIFNSLKAYKNQYLYIREEFNDYFESYLLKHITDEYLSIIKNCDMSKKNIA